MQFLYAWEINRPEIVQDALLSFYESMEKERAYYTFAEKLIYGVIEHIDEIDNHIRSMAKNWTFDRIAKVDLSILRLAFYELIYCDDIPPIVTINEAVNLGKAFSKEDSKRFINGILDRYKNQLDRPLRQAAGQPESADDILDGLVD